jgi:hypothetical protein
MFSHGCFQGYSSGNHAVVGEDGITGPTLYLADKNAHYMYIRSQREPEIHSFIQSECRLPLYED